MRKVQFYAGSADTRQRPGCSNSTATSSYLQMVRLCEITLLDGVVMRAMNVNASVTNSWWLLTSGALTLYYNAFTRVWRRVEVAKIC